MPSVTATKTMATICPIGGGDRLLGLRLEGGGAVLAEAHPQAAAAGAVEAPQVVRVELSAVVGVEERPQRLAELGHAGDVIAGRAHVAGGE